jgi:hypothetical protein
MSDVREDGFPGGLGRLTPGTVDSAGNPIDAQRSRAAPAKTEVDAIDAELDAEQAQREQRMRRLGFTDAEISNQRGAAGEPKSVPSLTSVEKELAALAEMRKSGDRAYWNSENQAKELRLLEQVQAAKSGKAPSESEGETAGEQDEDGEPTAADARLAKIDDELAALQEKRQGVKGAERDKLDARERELLGERETVDLGRFIGDDVATTMRDRWADQGGIEARLGVVAGMVRSLSESMSPAEVTEFGSSFDALPAKVRVAVLDQFSIDGGSLSARRAAIEKSLTGADLAAVQKFWSRWSNAVQKGLVG